MQSSLTRFEKLLRLKSMRQQIAEARTAVARRVQNEAEMTEDSARRTHARTVDNAAEIRLEKLRDIFSAKNSHKLHISLASNAYLSTEADIARARSKLEEASEVVKEAGQNTALALAQLGERIRERKKTAVLIERMTLDQNLMQDRRT
jgi:hypothetical protein